LDEGSCQISATEHRDFGTKEQELKRARLNKPGITQQMGEKVENRISRVFGRIGQNRKFGLREKSDLNRKR
jgi:hypothetical protein